MLKGKGCGPSYIWQLLAYFFDLKIYNICKPIDYYFNFIISIFITFGDEDSLKTKRVHINIFIATTF